MRERGPRTGNKSMHRIYFTVFSSIFVFIYVVDNKGEEE